MRIDLTRSGGYGGLTVRSSVDTAELEPEEAQALETLVDEVDWASLAGPAPTPGTADRFSYRLTVTGADGQSEVVVGEASMTPALRRLVDDVLARRRGPA